MKTGQRTLFAALGLFLLYKIASGSKGNAGSGNGSFLGGGCELPRGIRNNNPGNLKYSNSNWQGKVPYSQNTDFDCTSGQVKRTFEQFTQYKYGIRALIKLILNYRQNYNLHSIRQIITRYAPGSENNTGAYVNAVANYMGFMPDIPLPGDADTMRLLVRAIGKHENGMEAISNTEFWGVWNEFFGGVAGFSKSVPMRKRAYFL